MEKRIENHPIGHRAKGAAILTVTVMLAGFAGATSLNLPSPNSPGRPAEGDRHVVRSIDGDHVYHERGSGPVVLLLPSLGRPASDFNELTAILSRAGLRTIAVDINKLRTPTTKLEENLFQLADSVEAVVSALGLSDGERIFVIGHAFGNRLARAYATSYRERVLSVVLLAAGGRVPIEKDALAALLDCFDPALPDAERLRSLRYAFFAKNSSIPAYWQVGWDKSLAQIQIRANRATPYQEWWDAGGAPLLVIQGDEDTIAPATDTSELLKAEFGDRVRIAVATSAGHALLPERPAFIADTIIAHLNSVRSGVAPIDATLEFRIR